jgi:hypothetical protein
MDDLSWTGDVPVIDVDEEVDLSLSKVDDCLEILTGLGFKTNLSGIV